MRVAVLGFDGPLARATRNLLESRRHVLVTGAADCAIYFPGNEDELANLVTSGDCGRLVLRSHAYTYGSSTKNPGMLSENRVSLLPKDAPERRWLALETITTKHPNTASVRLTNVLAPEENDLLVVKLSKRFGLTLAGHDPNVQFITVQDAAQALVDAAESRATGLFNAAGEGAIPLSKAFLASGTQRIPCPAPLARATKAGHSIAQLQYNWTVSTDRARRELGWCPASSTCEALADFVKTKPGSRYSVLERPYDLWGLDTDYIHAWSAWFSFVRKVYWRIDHEGIENIPANGRALYVSNHRGFIPIDAVMHLFLIRAHRNRIPRFLIIHTLLRFPYLCNFLTKLGGVIASQENAAKLFAEENLVGIFPEGIRGTFTPYRHAYELRDFSKSEFVKLAIENQAPIIPAVVIGHAEIFPIIGRIDSSYVRREWGWPYLPIAPMFPLLPIPLPSKWHIRVLEPIPLRGLSASDAENDKLVADLSRHVQSVMQRNIDDMTARRKHIFWGKVLNGRPATSDGAADFPLSRAAGGAS
jgi:1-acyl-sn-glycerol-3-phosphate acyltransferase